MGLRPIVFIDSELAQLDWIGIPRGHLLHEGLRRGKVIISHRVNYEPSPSTSPATIPRAHYRGIDLRPAVHYAVCVRLELTPGEFDPKQSSQAAEWDYWLRCASSLVDKLLHLIDSYRPAAFVVMQGYFIEATLARQIAYQRGIQVYALENTVNPARIICEPLTGLAVNRNSFSGWWFRNTYAADVAPTAQPALLTIKESKSVDHRSPDTPFHWPKGLGRCVFFAQCLTDSSVLYSDFRGSAVDIAERLVAYATQRGIFAVIKLHPKESGGMNPLGIPYNQTTWRKMHRQGTGLQRSSPHHCVDIGNEYGTERLISDADVVVTINSQAGLEALARGKEVVTLGNSFYDVTECTWRLPDLALLAPTLDLIMSGRKRNCSAQRVDALLRLYFDHYCVRRDARSLVASLIGRRLRQDFWDE